jgi:hypothetical protein
VHRVSKLRKDEQFIPELLWLSGVLELEGVKARVLTLRAARFTIPLHVSLLVLSPFPRGKRLGVRFPRFQ